MARLARTSGNLKKDSRARDKREFGNLKGKDATSSVHTQHSRQNAPLCISKKESEEDNKLNHACLLQSQRTFRTRTHTQHLNWGKKKCSYVLHNTRNHVTDDLHDTKEVEGFREMGLGKKKKKKSL